MKSRKQIIKALQFHVREWDFTNSDVKRNFGNDVRQYLSWMVKSYPALRLRI